MWSHDSCAAVQIKNFDFDFGFGSTLGHLAFEMGKKTVEKFGSMGKTCSVFLSFSILSPAEPLYSEAYEKLYEAVKTKGNADAAKNIKASLKDWRGLQELLGKKEPSVKQIAEKWKMLQKSNARALCVLH